VTGKAPHLGKGKQFKTLKLAESGASQPKTKSSKGSGQKTKSSYKSRAKQEQEVEFAIPQAPASAILTTSSVPSSPNKRRQGASHYSDVECSPSKKRISPPFHVTVPAEERGLLFGVSRRLNSNTTTEELADVSMASVGGNASLVDMSVDVCPKHLEQVKRDFGQRSESTNSLFGLGGEFEKTTLTSEDDERDYDVIDGRTPITISV